MSAQWPKIRLGEVLKQIWREEVIDPSKKYSLLGAHWYAKGLYIKDVKSGQEIRAEKLYKVQSGDFVYNRLFAWKGSFAITEAEVDGCYVSNEFPCFEVNRERLDGKFLWLYFKRANTWTESLGLSAGATPTSRNRLKESLFLKMEIPLPPLAEQNRIVARIEELAAQINEARKLRNQTVAEVDALKGSLERYISFIALGEKYGWEPLGAVTKMQGGYAFKSHELGEGGISIVKIANVENGRLNWCERTTIEQTRLNEFQPFQLEENDFLMAMTRPVIRGAIKVARVNHSDLPCLLNQRVGRFRYLNPKVDPDFFFRFLLSEYFRGEVEVRCQGGQQPNIGNKEIESILVPIAPLPKQHQIVVELDALQKEFNMMKNLQAETTTEVDTLLPSILDRAFRGNL